ncbi:DNA adenine methylase, partial [Lactobacillus delbrueckii subsp. bulgaricus]
FAVWYAVLNKTEDLIGLIDSTSVTLTEWHTQRSIHEKSYEQPYSMENAFSTLFLNRTNVSGIIQGGPIGGQSQAG